MSVIMTGLPKWKIGIGGEFAERSFLHRALQILARAESRHPLSPTIFGIASFVMVGKKQGVSRSMRNPAENY